jgi:GNAT superfamily N-acetyltransferase
MQSHYASYIKEQLPNAEVVETDFGFITCQLLTDGEVFLRDIYVMPEKRSTNCPGELLNLASGWAIKHGARVMVATVHTNVGNPSRTLAFALKHGWEVTGAESGAILVMKSLEA